MLKQLPYMFIAVGILGLIGSVWNLVTGGSVGWSIFGIVANGISIRLWLHDTKEYKAWKAAKVKISGADRQE